jgi:peptide deformylase
MVEIYPILQHPDPRLSQPAEVVETVNDAIRIIVKNMFATHYAQKNCAALAATQLGVPLRITVIDFSEKKDEPLCLINPEIIERSDEMLNEFEGCMSVGGRIHERVKRHRNIRVNALNEQGESFELDAADFLSRCIQHELDHLDGTLFIDRLSPLKRKIVDRKFSKRLKKG